MKFSDLFKDDNNINEKSVAGFTSFFCMIITLLIDLITGWLGRELVVHEFIFNGFLFITLGCFGISAIDKRTNRNAENEKTRMQWESEEELDESNNEEYK